MASTKEKDLVLVTGGSGFIASHCILACLQHNYRVRTTVRSLTRADEVRAMIRAGGLTNISDDDLTFVEADLLKDDGWAAAADSCKYVLHVASPLTPPKMKHEDELIIPAREGTLRVLRAARDAGVKRVVVTSSLSAVEFALRSDPSKILDEKDWTDTEAKGLPAYPKSKTLAERAAWEFVQKEGNGMELATIIPSYVLGPILAVDTSLSIDVVKKLMDGSMPGCPHLLFGIVDVRDVADLHIRAMTNPKAKNERFLCDSPPQMSVKEISTTLRENLGGAAKKCPTMMLPGFVLKVIGLFDPTVALVVPDLGRSAPVTVEKAKRLLDWEPRSKVEAIVSTAESLIKFGVIKAKA